MARLGVRGGQGQRLIGDYRGQKAHWSLDLPNARFDVEIDAENGGARGWISAEKLAEGLRTPRPSR